MAEARFDLTTRQGRKAMRDDLEERAHIYFEPVSVSYLVDALNHIDHLILMDEIKELQRIGVLGVGGVGAAMKILGEKFSFEELQKE